MGTCQIWGPGAAARQCRLWPHGLHGAHAARQQLALQLGKVVQNRRSIACERLTSARAEDLTSCPLRCPNTPCPQHQAVDAGRAGG